MAEPSSKSLSEEADRRRYARRGIRDVPLVQPVAGEVVDLSPGGLGVCAAGGLPVNQKLYVTIGPEGSRVRILGQVVWCRLTGSRDNGDGDWIPCFRAGIRFSEFPD